MRCDKIIVLEFKKIWQETKFNTNISEIKTEIIIRDEKYKDLYL